jgi:hypothetical protein
MPLAKNKIQAPTKKAPLRRGLAIRNGRAMRRDGPVLSRAPALLQPALKVGAANDPLEREAENTAERIVSMPSQDVAAPAAAPSSSADPAAQRATIEDQPGLETLETEPPIPDDHQDPEVPAEEDVDTTELDSGDMKEMESGNPTDTGGEPPAAESPAAPAEGGAPADQPAAEEQPAAQPARSGDAAVVGAEGGPAPRDVSQRVAQPGTGRPLPDHVRTFMEPRFGNDFSDVRIHDAPEDRQAARRIGARAFTHRRHIWLGPGETVDNRRLMAHELTHVVQQTKRKSVPTVKRQVEASEEASEPEVRRGYIRNKAEKYARKIPGYRLVSFILGKSPITGKRVVRNATNLIGALLGMIPGGELLFERLQESRVIEKAYTWISARLNKLNITWTRIKGLISDLIDYLPAWPSNAVRYAKKLFGPIVRDIITFIGEVKDKILEFIIKGALSLAGPWAEKVWGVIQKAGSIISTILKDPLGFAKNLFAAALRGFKQFGTNVLQHLKKGLLGWLFGAIQGLEIQIPDKLDFKGLISIGLQVVGLTYDNFRAQLVKRLGKNGEQKVAFIEKSVEVVKILVKEGFVGIWQRVLEMIDNFKQTMIGGIQDFVRNSLIMGGLSWLAGLTNPVGAIVKVVLAIYNIVKTFLERLDQILEVANSIFSSVGAIAAGKVQQAADFIEKTIGATVPIVISFVAALVPISGITNSIRGIIKKLQAPVKKAMGKMITFLVKKSKKLFSKLIGKLNKKRKLPSANFKIGKATHRIYAEKKGKKKIEIMIASGAGKPIDDIKALQKVELDKIKEPDAKKTAGAIAGETKEGDKEIDKVAAKVDLSSQKKNQKSPLEKLEAEIKEAAEELGLAGKDISKIPTVSEDNAVALFRAIEPRDPSTEGLVGTHGEMKKKTTQKFPGSERPKSSYFEVDHIIEKRFPKAIVMNLHNLDKDQQKPGEPIKIIRVGDPSKPKTDASGGKIGEKTATRSEKGTPFGKIGADKLYINIPDMAPNFPGMIIFHKLHKSRKGGETANAGAVVEAAAKSEDPHATLREKLSKQLSDELNEITSLYSGDKTAPEPVKIQVSRGAKMLQKLNREIYALGKQGTPPKAHKKGKSDPSKPAEVTFSPGANAGDQPDFQKDEGVGQAHSAFAAGRGRFFEYDHIIDKSYPLNLKDLTMGAEQLAGTAKAQVKEDKDPAVNAEREARMEQLNATSVFSGTGVGSYSGPGGYAVALYRPIAKAVTSAVPVPNDVQRDVLSGIGGGSTKSIGTFIRKGGRSRLKNAKAEVRAHVKKKFLERTEAHSNAVATRYSDEIKKVALINPKNPQPAKQAMTVVTQRVAASLKQARTETGNLFN